ncbi:MAG: MerR family transcriptional regulator [Planctomycetota bacterium]
MDTTQDEPAPDDVPLPESLSVSPATEKRVALVGRLGSMSRRHAANLLKSYGAVVTDAVDDDTDWAIIGAEESPLAEQELLSPSSLERAGRGDLEIIHEGELWQRIGLVDSERSPQQYYTPVMLAKLLGISVHVVRRWQRRGLIRPVRTMHRLPYFDFREVATAKRLAHWIDSGASPRAIEQRLVDLIEGLPDIQRPLDQLSILIEGKHVLLRQGEGLIEPGGQLRFDFDAAEPSSESDDDRMVFAMETHPKGTSAAHVSPPVDDDLLQAAFDADDDDDLETAIDCYHAILARDGPRPDICFELGELLYRTNETIAARERFYAAIELDPEFVEARASLGMVLSETGQDELAVAAFRGVLTLHEDYAEVHYHLAKLLSHHQRGIEAASHWRRFLQLAPDSPWKDEAQAALEEQERS